MEEKYKMAKNKRYKINKNKKHRQSKDSLVIWCRMFQGNLFSDSYPNATYKRKRKVSMLPLSEQARAIRLRTRENAKIFTTRLKDNIEITEENYSDFLVSSKDIETTKEVEIPF